jgi:nicotinate dehydrogenase subunit A
MPAEITLHINGRKHTIEADPEEPLLYILRNDFELNGPKFGCGLQQCGTCMILVNDQNEPTCLKPCVDFEGKKLETIEGLSKGDKLHPVQEAFVEEQAAQCGYCVNGMLVSAVALLRKNRSPEEAEIREALHQVICRCGTHSRFIKAVKRAAQNGKNS